MTKTEHTPTEKQGIQTRTNHATSPKQNTQTPQQTTQTPQAQTHQTTQAPQEKAATHFDAFLGVDTPTPSDYDAPPPPQEKSATHFDAFLGVDTPPPSDYDAPQPTVYETAARYNYTPTHAAYDTCGDGDLLPPWVQKKSSGYDIDGWAFVRWFIAQFDVKCINGRFYLGDVYTPHTMVKHSVVEEIEPYAEVSVQKIANIVGLLEMKAATQMPPTMPEACYFTNCTIVLSDQGAAEELQQATQPTQPKSATHFDAFLGVDTAKQTRKVIARSAPPAPFCPCRIPHKFESEAPEPTALLAFLDELFYPEDIPTVQEYLGYCLFPSTKAQKALFIIGNGGEGKSRLTVLMQQILGDVCVIASVGQIGTRFFGTMLQNRLLFMDDDLQCKKFTDTDTFKSLVSNECNILVEPKGKEHYTINPYARFLLMGNQSIGSLHDRSDGFYRRVHIIRVRPCNKKRTHNPNIIQQIWQAEQDGIIRWLVMGAVRLARQNYILTESPRSKQELSHLKETDNTALEFLMEQPFVYGKNCTVTSSQLSHKYREWCYDNDLFKVSGQTFKQTCEDFFAEKEVEYTKNLVMPIGKVRGFKGVGY